jgi:hypothetical protein
MSTLNLKVQADNLVPYLKFNSKVGRWYTKNDDGREIEVGKLSAIFDLRI